MTREKRLGRGLEALLGKATVEVKSEPSPYDMLHSGPVLSVHRSEEPVGASPPVAERRPPDTIDVLRIEPNPFQPRREFDEAEIESLAGSMQAQGLIQAITVRRHGERFQIIAGERRWRAAMRLGWSEIAANVREAEDRDMSEFALTENMQRVDLNAIEKATAFARYLQMFGGTREALAQRLALDRSTVANLLRLLDLPQELQQAVARGTLSNGHVRALLGLDAPLQLETAERIVREGWSVRQTEQFVRDIHAGKADSDAAPDHVEKIAGKNAASAHLASLEQEFRNRLGAKVKLSHANGKGKITIPFASNEEFERLYKMICGK